MKNEYTKKLESCIRQMLQPIKDIPLSLVIENLDVDVKCEFNADNARLYAPKMILTQGVL